MEENPIKNDRRRARRRRRLGEDRSCLLCGCRDPEALTRVSVSLLEDHHVAGRKADPDLTVTVCLNCHRSLQEGLKDAGLEARAPEDPLQATQALCIGMADFFRLAIESLRDRALELKHLTDELDRRLPDWRERIEDDE